MVKITGWIVGVLVLAMGAGAFGADPNASVTAWALGGSGVQELRIGYDGLLPDVELAVGGLHRDDPAGADEWAVRGYLIAHAIDTDMVAQWLGHDIELPQGDIYGGLFADYCWDRADEFSGGPLVGGLVRDLPKGWETVAEYQWLIWNTTDNGYLFVAGLRKRF